MDYNFKKTATEISEIEEQNNNIKNINQNINDKIASSIYNNLISINSIDLFKYIVIIIICISFSSIFKIKLNIIIGSIIGLFIVYLLYDKKDLTNATYQNQLIIKLSLIRPKPKYFDNYSELIELFYSIRDFYNYNSTVFKQVIIEVDLILLILNDIKQNIINCKYNVDVLQDKKREVLNHLSSMIYTIENNKLIEKKLQNAVNTLHKILNNYETEAIQICNNQILVNGYDNSKIYINHKGPIASNEYSIQTL